MFNKQPVSPHPAQDKTTQHPYAVCLPQLKTKTSNPAESNLTLVNQEWNGGELTDDDVINNTAIITETDDIIEASPIEDCTGIVLDNLEENMPAEEIKTLLKTVCSDDSLESCTIHPTGSLKSKIIKDIETSLIPSIAKKVDKKSYKGRMIFCKPFVPKTPPKSEHPSSRKENPKPEHPASLKKNSAEKSEMSLNEHQSNKEEQTSNLDVNPSSLNEHQSNKEEQTSKLDVNPSSLMEASKSQSNSKAQMKQVIPGLPEEKRKKALKTKDKKEKKTKEGKKPLKDNHVKIIPNQQFFLLHPKTANNSKTEDVNLEFEFSDGESEEFEDSKEELELDENAFATPVNFKSHFGRVLARSESESRIRSRSTSVKRQLSSSSDGEAGKKTKASKSGLPTARKNIKSNQ